VHQVGPDGRDRHHRLHVSAAGRSVGRARNSLNHAIPFDHLCRVANARGEHRRTTRETSHTPALRFEPTSESPSNVPRSTCHK